MTFLYFIVGLAAILMLAAALVIAAFGSLGGGATSGQAFMMVLLFAGSVTFGLFSWWALRKSDKWPN